MNLEFERKLTIPMETKAMYPVTPDLVPVVQERAEALRRIFEGEDVLIAFSQGLVRWETAVSDENFPYVFQIDENRIQ